MSKSETVYGVLLEVLFLGGGIDLFLHDRERRAGVNKNLYFCKK